MTCYPVSPNQQGILKMKVRLWERKGEILVTFLIGNILNTHWLCGVLVFCTDENPLRTKSATRKLMLAILTWLWQIKKSVFIPVYKAGRSHDIVLLWEGIEEWLWLKQRGENFSPGRRGGDGISWCSVSSQMAVLSVCGQNSLAPFISSSQHCFLLFGQISRPHTFPGPAPHRKWSLTLKRLVKHD